MNSFERKATSARGKVVDLAVQVFRHEAQMEGLRGIDDLWQNMEVSGNATEMPLRSLVKLVSLLTPTRMEPWRWTY